MLLVVAHPLAEQQPGDQEPRQHEERVEREDAAGGEVAGVHRDREPDREAPPAVERGPVGASCRRGGARAHLVAPCRLHRTTHVSVRRSVGSSSSQPPIAQVVPEACADRRGTSVSDEAQRDRESLVGRHAGHSRCRSASADADATNPPSHAPAHEPRAPRSMTVHEHRAPRTTTGRRVAILAASGVWLRSSHRRHDPCVPRSPPRRATTHERHGAVAGVTGRSPNNSSTCISRPADPARSR